MKKIVILSAGPGLPKIVDKYGHSSDWIPHILSSYDLDFDIRKVYENDFGLCHENVDGWIITGSKYSVYDNIEWIKNIKSFLLDIFKTEKPILGICFGHQLIAQALGGVVKKNTLGWELGSYNIRLTKEGAKNMLFDGVGANDIFYESHQDTVIKLPYNSISLAETDKSNQSFIHGNHIYGVQFHPEFSWEVTKMLMDIRIKKGIQIDSEDVKKSIDGVKILRNFVHILESEN